MSFLNRLIEQAKNPKGSVGSLMLSIMNRAHYGMNTWAFSLGRLDIESAAVMLDIGVGGGQTIRLLSEMNTSGKLYGIDYSEQAVINSIKANRENVKRGRVDIRQASVALIPFQEGSFDVVTAFQTHYFWPDLEHDLQEVFRVLKQNGRFMMVAETYKINYHMKSYKTKEEMRELLDTTGFKSIEFHGNAKKGWLCVIAVK